MSHPEPVLLTTVSSRTVQPQLRCICFPYAGGNRSSFIRFAALVPSWLEVVVLDLPGRAERQAEPAFRQLTPILQLLLAQYQRLTPLPTLFYGHSFGARIGYEFLHCLQNAGLPLPQLMVAAAARAPHLTTLTERYSELSDAEFIRHLAKLGDASTGWFDDAELLSQVLPALRADFRMVDDYQPTIRAPLPVRGLALCAERDPAVSAEQSQGWEMYFTEFNQQVLPQRGHFFIDTHPEEVAAILLPSLRHMRRCIGESHAQIY